MTVDCPHCGYDDAYCNGLEYECPNCGHVWPCPEIDEAEAEYEDD